jgi:TM2 domain-containing membrane protein YozV
MEQRNEWRRQLTVLVLSFVAGYLGVDRFYKGQVGWGVVKLITVGGAGIWYLVDLAIAAYEFGKTDRQMRESSASRS